MANKTLTAAKSAKEDEFYTQLVDIERELVHYKEHFRGKTVLCNCDDPRVSNFFKYFTLNFEHLGLKQVIATCYKSQKVDLFSTGTCDRAVYQIYNGDRNGNSLPDNDEIEVIPFEKGDGDFRSTECKELLKQADIVVTNPPFSLFREYVAQLIEYDKKFLIIGNQNAITYKEIFPLIKENKLWLGLTGGNMVFTVPDSYEPRATRYWEADGIKYRSMGNTYWFTNLDHQKRHEDLILYKRYTSEEYPHYDNYDAIEVSKVSEIPIDYDGVMGVPITFIHKYNPNQFEILGHEHDLDGFGKSLNQFTINGKGVFKRLLIRKK